MTSHYLLQPLTLPCGAVLPNRIAKAALSESLSNASTNAPNEKHVELYRHWSEKTKAGMLLTGNIQVDRRYLETPMNVVVEDERDLDVLRKWSSVMSHGTQLWAQISHPGRQCPQSVTSQPLGPSDNPSPVGMPTIKPSRAMTTAEISDVIKRFVTTATILKKAGFHGIQLHAAHGYLLSQFLSAYTNKRTDDYGGSLQNRMRLLLEIYDAVRAAVGPSFPIGVKLNSGDFTKGGFSEDESIEVVKALEARGVDLLEVSGGTYENAKMTEKIQRDSTKQREAFFLAFAHRAKQEASKMPIMLTGGIRSRLVMENIIKTNQADVIGLGRPFAVNLSALQGLLDGTTDFLPSKDISTGSQLLDLGLEALWHAQQFHRICAGLEPDMNLSPLKALKALPLIYIYHPRKAGWRTVANILLFGIASYIVYGFLNKQN